MVNLVYCLRRLPDLSREEFQRYWRENHGPLVRKNATAMNCRRYVQVHTKYDVVIDPLRVPRSHPESYDGVAELWWDSIAELAPENPSPERQQANAEHFEDEKKFIDHSQSPVWLAEEHVFIDDVPEAPLSDQENMMVKLVYCLRRLPNLSREEFQRYWREKHGPLVQKQKDTLNIRRYVQVHTSYDDRNEAMRSRANRPEPYDGVAELWWDGVEEFLPEKPTPEQQRSQEALAEDEQRFIDWSRSPVWLGKERVFVDEIS